MREKRNTPKKRAFTLVELLVVIAIIGLLAALITSASSAALRYARVASCKITISQVAFALEQYKIKYGEYPPDWSDHKAVVRHVNKRWPRFVWYTSSTNDTDKYYEFCQRIYNATGWNPAEIGCERVLEGEVTSPYDISKQQNFAHGGAIAFWLGGLPDNAIGSNKGGYTLISGVTDDGTVFIPSTDASSFVRLTGFSTNPEDPFNVHTFVYKKDPDGHITNKLEKVIENPREKPFAEFEVGKNLAVMSITPPDDKNIFPVVWVGAGMVTYFKANLKGGTYLDADGIVKNLKGTYLHTDGTVKNLWNIQQYPSLGYAYKFSTHVNYPWTGFYPGVAVPYQERAGKWCSPDGFQLVHPGLDGKFGAWTDKGGDYGNCTVTGGRNVNLDSGDGITQYDLDNLIYIGECVTVQERMP